MNAANDSLRVNGVGRDAEDPRTLVIYLNERPTDDDLRRIHDLLRHGAQPVKDDGQLSVNSGAEMAQPDEQNTASPDPPLSDLNDSALPREPL